MDKQTPDLTELWKAQSVPAIDVSEIKKNLISERRKQRIFMLLDCSAVLPALYLLHRYWDALSSAAQVFQVIMLVTALPLLVYQLWLRRIAAFYRSEQTQDHLASLIKQIQNNVRIAFITKHSTWLASLCMCLFFAERYLSGALSDEKVIRNTLIVVLISAAMAVWYRWANKRQKRLQKKLQRLCNLQENR